MAEGPAPDRFLVGLAVLNLLSDAGADRPLLCLVDDEQWLDRASAQALAFAARRLGAESVGLVFAAREPSDAVAGLPALVLRGLRGGDARALLDSVLTGAAGSEDSRPNRRRDGRQPSGPARATTGTDRR